MISGRNFFCIYFTFHHKPSWPDGFTCSTVFSVVSVRFAARACFWGIIHVSLTLTEPALWTRKILESWKNDIKKSFWKKWRFFECLFRKTRWKTAFSNAKWRDFFREFSKSSSSHCWSALHREIWLRFRLIWSWCCTFKLFWKNENNLEINEIIHRNEHDYSK